jgi:hypothetical protein
MPPMSPSTMLTAHPLTSTHAPAPRHARSCALGETGAEGKRGDCLLGVIPSVHTGCESAGTAHCSSRCDVCLWLMCVPPPLHRSSKAHHHSHNTSALHGDCLQRTSRDVQGDGSGGQPAPVTPTERCMRGDTAAQPLARRPALWWLHRRAGQRWRDAQADQRGLAVQRSRRGVVPRRVHWRCAPSTHAPGRAVRGCRQPAVADR